MVEIAAFFRHIATPIGLGPSHELAMRGLCAPVQLNPFALQSWMFWSFSKEGIGSMNILIVGNGGREHALAWKIAQSPRADRVFVAPGNAGTDLDGENVPIEATDIPALLRFAQENDVRLT
ncbi:MAG: phosphoribosylamine--glycine ligase N-terminal domain-containing protein, partial [Thermoguttaceae bacterium]